MSDAAKAKLKKKKSVRLRGPEPPPRVEPPEGIDPPTLSDYLLHLFDGNKLRAISPNKLNDSQFFWLLNDLGLGLIDDEVSVLCRRAPQAANNKVDWESFAPRCEELLIQTFRTRDWNSFKRKGESTYAKLQDPVTRAFYFYNRANNESEWEDLNDEEQLERVEGFVTRPEPTIEADASDFIVEEPVDEKEIKGASYGKKGFRRGASIGSASGGAGNSFDANESLTAVAKLRGLQAEMNDRETNKPPRPAPPSLGDYLRKIFVEADKDGSDSLNEDEFWELFNGLGLDLKENDILILQKAADKDLDGTVSFAEFAPSAEQVLKDLFASIDYEKENMSPWMRLYDPDSGAPYFMNRLTFEAEWVTGEPEQKERMGNVPLLPLSGVAKETISCHVPPDLETYVEKIFHEQDVDGSGELDEDELWWLLHTLGLGLTDTEFRKIGDITDTDKNGNVSWAEFGPAALKLLKNLFKKKQFEVFEENPWCLLCDAESGARYYYNRKTGESEWVDGSVEQGEKVGTPFVGKVEISKPDPPSLEEYLFRLFSEHDKDHSGEIDSDEMWHVLTGMGLGLTDEEIQEISEKADADHSGHINWEEFLIVGIDMLADIFDNCDWDEHDTPWVKLYDESTKAFYFFDRSTGESEWVDGSPEQAARVGIMPVVVVSTEGKEEVKPIDMNSDDAPLPFGGQQFLEALVLGKEERAKALLASFKTERRRQRVLQHTRIEEYGFTAAHCAAVGGGIEIIQEVLRLQPELLAIPALNGDTPLHLACLWKQRNAARLLVALGAEVTTKNNDGETPLDMAPPALAERLVKDLNAILTSWKGPLPYPNPAAADDLLKTEKQQRAERERKRLEAEAEEAARVREEERQEALIRKEEEYKKAAIEREKQLEIENGLREADPEVEEDDGLTRVQRWLQNAPSVDAIKAAGREVVAPNELIVRVYSARHLFPPESYVRKGKYSDMPELKPAAIVIVDRKNSDGRVESIISSTKVLGKQDDGNLKISRPGWIDEASVLLGENDPTQLEMDHTSCLSPHWGEQFSIADDKYVENRIAIAKKVWQKEQDKKSEILVGHGQGQGGLYKHKVKGKKQHQKLKKRSSAYALAVASNENEDNDGDNNNENKHDNDDFNDDDDDDVDVEGNFKLKICIAHWPDDEDQEEAEIKRRKKMKEGKLCTPSLNEASPLAVLDLPINALSHPPTLNYPTIELSKEVSPIPAGGGRRGPSGEFRAWFPLEPPSIARRKDTQPASFERLKEESEAVISGLAGRSGGKPPVIGTPGLDIALAKPPPWVSVPSYATKSTSSNPYSNTERQLLKYAAKKRKEEEEERLRNGEESDMGLESDMGEDQAVTNAWEERAKEIKPGGHKDIRRFLSRMKDDTKPSGLLVASGEDSDQEIMEFEEDEERYEPLLGHSVRVKDPSDIYNSAAEETGKPSKSYPLISSRFQLGEFAGFVQEDLRTEESDCFVLLDSNLSPEDFAYGEEHSDSDSDSDAEEKAPALRRTLLPRKHPAVSDPSVTIFRKKHLTFVPDAYGAIQLGLFWRYNPRLPPARLPEKECREITDMLMMEVITGLIASIGVSEHKNASDAPFSVQEWQGGSGDGHEADNGLLATMQSQQLMQMQLMQQMQRMQLQQLRAVEEANNRPPPVIEQIVPVVEVKPETPRPSTAERKRMEEEANFLASFVSAFDWYEGERFPINYLTPPDVAVLFETMGWQKCIGKVLESPVDGATLAIMRDEDVALLGLELPSQRRRLMQEIILFKELGAPQASLVNPQSLDVFTAAAETLAVNRMEAMQQGLTVQPPAFDGQALLDMMATMGAHHEEGAPPPQEQPQAELPPPTADQEFVPSKDVVESAQTHNSAPGTPQLDSANFRPSSENRPRTAEPSEEYLMALANSLDNLPQLFYASGKPDKPHKVRKTSDLSSEEVNKVFGGDEVVVSEVGSTFNSLGEEVDRFLLSAPVIGWVSAANFKYEMDLKKQTTKYYKKVEGKMSSKLKKEKKKMEEEAKKKAKIEELNKKKLAKEEAAEQKAKEKREKEAAKQAKNRHNKKKKDIEPDDHTTGIKSECYGKWIAKGEKAQKIENKVRMKAELDSAIAGKVMSAQIVNVIGETTIMKSDGMPCRRLQINQPKAGWITAHNFEQVGKEGKKEEEGAE